MEKNSPFKRTNRKGRSGHRHLVYLRGEIGYTSTNKGHSHRVIRSVNPEAAGWEVLLEDGHDHTLEDFTPNEVSIPDEEENEIISDCKRLLRLSEDYEADFRKKGKESERFVSLEGEGQWDKAVKNKLEGEDRPALTFNEIEPKLDLLTGYQTRNRTDIRYLPVEGGDARVADLLSILVKNITEQNNYDVEETEVFEDEAIVGRGLFNVDVSYEDNFEGDIKIERFPWKDCYLGQHNKKTGEDREYDIKERWYSLAKIKQLWPEKAEEIQAKYQQKLEPDGEFRSTPDDEYAEGDLGEIELSPDFVDIAKKEFRVLEVWRREYSRVVVLADPENDFFLNTEGWNKEDVQSVKTIPVLTSVQRNISRLRVTKIAAATVLEDYYSDLFERYFPIVPVYAKKRGKTIWGKVEPLKDPQREVNKRRSQIADILNKVACYGWFYDDQTFMDEREERKFKKNSSRPGFCQKVDDVTHKPEKVEGIKFPGELATYDEIASGKMKEIANINPDMLGMPSNAPSGIAAMERKRAGLIGNEFLYDNLALAKRVIGRILIRLIQKVYTPERIMRIVANRVAQHPNEGNQVGGKSLQESSEQELLTLLQTDDLSKYDVVVSENPHSATSRQATFQMWAELASQGVPVPPTYLAELSDVPDKEKLIEGIQQMQQAEQASEDKKYQTELMKTIIGQQGKSGGTSPKEAAR